MSASQRPQRTRNKFLREKRDRKRNEAAVRQAAYDALTLEQKLAKLGDRPAVKQRAKLVLAAMQTAEAKNGVKAAFNATPEQMGEAAVEQAKKRKGNKARRQARKDKKAND